MVGCGSQQATPDDSAATTAQSQEEIIAELKDAIANVPAYKSVTITEVDSAFSNDNAATNETGNTTDALPDVVEATSVYKFDASGNKLKTSVDSNTMGVKMQYYTDGDNAVYVSDGPVYSGTTEQFNLSQANGVEAYVTETIGDLGLITDCIANVTKQQQSSMTVYTLELDPKEYVKSDEALSILSDYGDSVKKAVITIGFNEDGRIVYLDNTTDFSKTVSKKNLSFADFDATVIDPMPKATKKYEDLQADREAKLDAMFGESDEVSAGVEEYDYSAYSGDVDASYNATGIVDDTGTSYDVTETTESADVAYDATGVAEDTGTSYDVTGTTESTDAAYDTTGAE